MLLDITLEIVVGLLSMVGHLPIPNIIWNFMDGLGKVYDVTEFLDGLLLCAVRN